MSFDHITRTALERATASVEGARHIGSQLTGYAGTNVQTLLEAIIGRVLPSGGTTGQALTKSSNTDYAVGWTTASGASPPFADNAALVKDDADATKLVRVDAGTVATGTTRVLTMPNADVDLGLQTPNTRTISTTAPLSGGGNLTADRTLSVGAASSTATGVVELATDAETTTGTDTTRATTPANVKAAIDARFGYAVVYWTFDGTAAITTGNKRVPVAFTGTIVKAWATASTAPTGSALIFDINYDGTTIWTGGTNRVQVAASANSGTQTTFSTTAVTEDHYFTCDIDAVGSGTSGSQIVVALKYKYAL